MPCFSIFVLYPEHEDEVINDLNDIYINRHARELRGDIDKKESMKNHSIYEIRICDQDAADFLRDLIDPFFVGYIRYTHSLEMFYKNARIQRPYIPPPRYNKLLKDIYWNAVQCERNKLTSSVR